MIIVGLLLSLHQLSKHDTATPQICLKLPLYSHTTLNTTLVDLQFIKMGGNTFKGIVETPRMPSEVYQEIKVRVIKLLRRHFRYASVPIEAPAKPSYGDLDVLICEPLSGPGQNEISKPENLSVLLEARLWKRVPNSPTINFALPWPESATSDVDNGPSSTSGDDVKTFGTSPPHKPTPKPTGRFIQLDIHLCSNSQELNWMLFDHAHGDMWNLLGSTIRRFGFIRNDKALYIVIPELAEKNTNKHLQKVKMTNDARKTLEYLGLDWDRFWKPFDNTEQMMDYAAGCRFHDPARGKKIFRGDDEGEEAMGGVRTKANDRRRAGQRSVFKQWLDEYLPEHVDDPAGAASRITKQEVVDDAKAFFGKEFAERFDAARKKGIVVVGSQKLWSDVRQTVQEQGAEGHDLGYTMKGLKRCIQGDKFELWIQEVLQKAAKDAKEDSPGATPILQPLIVEDSAALAPEERDKGLDEVGYEVPSLDDARRDFREMRYELVKEWIMEDGKWKMIGEKQREKDERESGEKLRMKMKKEEEMEEERENEKESGEKLRMKMERGEEREN